MYQKSGHELLVVPQGFDDRVIKVDLREGNEKNTVEELALVMPKRNFPLRKLMINSEFMMVVRSYSPDMYIKV